MKMGISRLSTAPAVGILWSLPGWNTLPPSGDRTTMQNEDTYKILYLFSILMVTTKLTIVSML